MAQTSDEVRIAYTGDNSTGTEGGGQGSSRTSRVPCFFLPTVFLKETFSQPSFDLSHNSLSHNFSSAKLPRSFSMGFLHRFYSSWHLNFLPSGFHPIMSLKFSQSQNVFLIRKSIHWWLHRFHPNRNKYHCGKHLLCQTLFTWHVFSYSTQWPCDTVHILIFMVIRSMHMCRMFTYYIRDCSR